MIFPVISKFNAELVKCLSGCGRDNIKYELFKHSMAKNSKVNSSDSLCINCPSYQQVSLAY